MKTIQLNETVIKVPQSWHDLTLGHYETFYRIKPTTPRERVEWAAKVCNVSASVLFDAPAEVFNIIAKDIDFLHRDNPATPASSIRIGGVNYHLDVDERLKLGAWIDAEDAQQGETPLSGVLAVVCRPAGEKYNTENTEMRQRMFAAQSVGDTLPLLAFFLLYYETYGRTLREFGRLRDLVEKLPKPTAILRRAGGGIKLFRIWRTITYWLLMRSLKRRLGMY